jgi:hypothetical protein
MKSKKGSKDERISRSGYRRVLALHEKAAVTKKAEKASQKEARKRADTMRKAQLATPQRAQVQSAIELSDTELPVVPPIPANQNITANVTKPVRVELGYQLYAYVGDRKVYSNAGQITMATFNYSEICLKADAEASKFARQNGGELGERSSEGFLRTGKITHYNKPLDDLEEWREMDKLGLMLLESSTAKHIRLDWEIRWPLTLPPPPLINDDEPTRRLSLLLQAVEDDDPVLVQQGVRVSPLSKPLSLLSLSNHSIEYSYKPAVS